MTHLKEYSLWLIPSGNVYNRLAKRTSALSRQFSTPNLQPHLTLLGELTGNEKKLLAKTSKLAAIIGAFDVKLNKVAFLDKYFGCLFIKAEKTKPLTQFNSKARKIFNRKKDSKYAPHVSLMYGNLDSKTKGKIIARIGSSFPKSFKVKNIYVYKVYGEPKDWRVVKKFALRILKKYKK